MLSMPSEADWRAFRQALDQASIAPEALLGATWTRRVPHPGCAGGERFWLHPAIGPAREVEADLGKSLLARELATHAYQMGGVRLLPRDLAGCPMPDPVPDAAWHGHEQDFPIQGEWVLVRLRALDLATRQPARPRSPARRRV